MKKQSAPLLLVLIMLVSFKGFSLPILNSLAAAKATIYLDFDGQEINSAYWNAGTPFFCAPSGMTDAHILEVFNRVAEDYRPFDINITTDENKFLAAPLSSRLRVIITPTSGWFTGVGGVSFIGSFKWGDDTPSFVFSDRLGPKNPKLVAECCSHESGHAVGLSHQSKYDGTCNLTATYNDGEGTGEASWAPIMGNSYYRNMSGWNNGPTPYGCSNKQDNLSIITSQNGFTYRKDDYIDDINNTTAAIAFNGTTVEGIISTTDDKDAFSFNLSHNSKIKLRIKPFCVDANYQGANLDIKMSLYNASKELIATFDPVTTMDVAVDTILNMGAYYILVDGTGNNNIDDYGSLGSYSMNASAVYELPLRGVTLTGIADKNKHSLKWDILLDETVKMTAVESSTDGIHFSTINTTNGLFNNFIYTPFQKKEMQYRLKVTTFLNKMVYSNTIMIRGVDNSRELFTASTFIRQEITVNAAENFQYLVSDVNGNAVARGYGRAGFNKLDLSRMPGGIYVLQLLGNKGKQTERIIKL